MGAHEGGHGLGFDEDFGADGESIMVQIVDDQQSNGQDLGSTYISTNAIRSCDVTVLQTQYGTQLPGGGNGGGGGGSQPAQCTPGIVPCNNCIPPSCWGGDSWNPTTCQCWLPTGNTPIIIDTDGSGFHLTSAANGVLFDFYGDGRPIQLAWTAPGSTNGWLALDRNGNGTIDSGRELFGNATPQPSSSEPNGFLALSVFDQPENGGNGDGIIDSHDAVWPKLVVWIDANHDGISQPDELHHLDDLGVPAIDLRYRESRYTDGFGNQFRYRGSLAPLRAEDVDRTIYDVILAYEVPWSADRALGSDLFTRVPFGRNELQAWPGVASGTGSCLPTR
jgi:hypothetical protein